MIIVTKKGNFKIESNYRDAFVLEVFDEKYIEECFDRYKYIVGDISSGILRLKGFDSNPKSRNYFGFIEDYLTLSCAMGCPYYVLKRIESEEELQKEQAANKAVKTDGFVIHPLAKESFDKEALTLESSRKSSPNIQINSQKLNEIPKGELSAELREYILQDTNSSKNNNYSRGNSNHSSKNANTNNKPAPEVAENTQSYVSSSPGFVPNQNKNNRYRPKNNKDKKKK